MAGPDSRNGVGDEGAVEELHEQLAVFLGLVVE